MTPAERVIDELEAHGSPARTIRGGWLVHCPAHEDRRPSLVVTEGLDGRALVHCRAGCRVEDVLGQIDLEMRDLFPEAA